MSDSFSQVITVQSPEEWRAILANPRFQPYAPDLQTQGRVGELYGMQVHVKETLCPVK